MSGLALLPQGSSPVDGSVRRVNMARLDLFEALKRDQEAVNEAAAQLRELVEKRDETMREALAVGHSIRSITDITGLGVGTVHNRKKELNADA